MPVSSDLGPEVSGVVERLAIEKLIFDQAVDRFDIALPSVAFGRDIAMLRTQSTNGRRQATVLFIFQELAAIISLPN